MTSTATPITAPTGLSAATILSLVPEAQLGVGESYEEAHHRLAATLFQERQSIATAIEKGLLVTLPSTWPEMLAPASWTASVTQVERHLGEYTLALQVLALAIETVGKLEQDRAQAKSEAIARNRAKGMTATDAKATENLNTEAGYSAYLEKQRAAERVVAQYSTRLEIAKARYLCAVAWQELFIKGDKQRFGFLEASLADRQRGGSR